MPNVPSVARQSSDVRVTLADRVLRYEITETFVNRGSRVGEADYMFPLPKGAAFQDLKLEINGEMIAGETMNADRARQIYEEIVRSQRDPALLEWMGYGLLRARIFPIAPGEEKRVIVRFQMVAPREGDALRIDYFRGLRRLQGETPDQSTGRTSFSLTFPSDRSYGTPYSPTHSLSSSSERGGNTRRVEVRNASGEVTLLLPVRRPTTAAISLLAHAPNADDGFALITLAPPAIVPRAVPRDLTFVIDVSGSMSGEKIRQARAAGKQFLASLSPADRFRLIDFSTDVRSFRDGFSAATRENVRAAERYVEDLEAQGSTNIGGALDEALSAETEAGRIPIILFMTDGLPTVGERDPAAIAERAGRRRGPRRIFTFGVGADLNVSLMEQLALEGRGTASFVRPEENVEHAVSVVASRLTSPLVTDVRVRADGVRLRKMHPSNAVDIFAGEDLILLTRYDGSGPATLRFEGRTTGGPVSWTSQVTFPERSRDNQFVARLWATQRVGYLSAEKRKHGGSDEMNGEIRELGERYGIPTEFTSYLVLEPGMDPRSLPPRLRGMAGGTSAGSTRLESVVTSAATAPANVQSFEAAKAAAAQRRATTLSDADAASGGSASATIRRAGGRTFILRSGIWTDTGYKPATNKIRVKAFSEAYFSIVERMPELREALALGEKVIVSGRDVAIEVAEDGAERLSDRELASLRERW
ncbi:MAG TPA: VIT domain-containing protein [Gemmatimonadaceae bacterium]|nr:VIT domain-containing protein [Gemmatimonadaceae bacterium]